MTELAAEIADGILVNASHPKDYEIALKHLEIGNARRKEKIRKFEVAAYTSFSVDPKPEKAIKAAKIVVAFIVGGSIPPILERHDIPLEEAQAIEKFLSHGKFKDAIGAVTPEMMDVFCIAGTPKECIDKIDELTRARVSQLVCGSPLGSNVPEAIRLIGKTIIPEYMARW